MRRVTRTEVATPYANCVACGIGTRSHILAPAEYESFSEEVAVAHSDDFASKGWEEVESVTKYALAVDAKVMCHKCWVKKQRALISIVDTHFDDWCKSPATSMRHIVKSLKVISYLSLEKEMPPQTVDKIRRLRVITKRLMLGEEE